MDADDLDELLFFDTFAHGASEEINLDLVQFPKPVIISQIRIIPLGARVQADFPGGVRLGATNPSQFHIEFFVNDLSKHGAAAFENLGALEYRQTSDIHVEFDQKKIPTDGLVLRGWYTTITLAVYGSLSKGLPAPLPDPRPGELSASAATAEWVQSQQAAIYRDPSYSYPPDFPPSSAEHAYVETWPNTAPPATVMPHSDPYDPSMAANWEQPPTEELKTWVPKEEYLKGQSPLKSNGGGDAKSRGRSEYWDERDDRRRSDEDGKRYKDRADSAGKDDDRRRDRDRTPDRSWRGFDARGRSKSHRESSWDRDRDRSPYSDENFRRRPKSPSSRSPKRPITPTDRFWSPERRDYRSPGARHRAPSPPRSTRTSEHLLVDVTGSPQTPLQSPVPPQRPEDRSHEEEQFEPILSDEDIIDELDPQYPDTDYDAPDDLEEIVKPFSPFTFQAQPLTNIPDPSKTLFETLNEGDTESLEAVKKLMSDVNLDANEDWITAVEQLPTHLARALKCPETEDLKSELIKWVWHGLSLDVALGHQQPGAKLRHIKGGIRLAGALCHCGMAEILANESALQERLLRLFHREQMALSIRLLILEALDAILLDHSALNRLITHKWELEISGVSECGTTYQHLLRMLEGKQQVRIKFALASLIQKFHIVEALENLDDLKNVIAEAKTDLPEKEIILNLQSVQRNFVHAATLLSQPRRFLPVQAQFEVKIDPKPSHLFLYRYFKKNHLLETLLMVLSGKNTTQAVQAAAYDILKEILKFRHGIAFFAANSVTTNALMKTLQAGEDMVETGGEGCLGLELALRLHILSNLDKLPSLNEESEVFNVLHEIFCATFSPSGKMQIANILAQDDSMEILLKHVDNFGGSKSVVRGYIIDLAEIAVRYSDDVSFLKHTGKILHELGECENSTKLLEPLQLIRPVEGLPEDVAVLSEILKKHAANEFCGTYNWELITAIRTLRLLCIPPDAQFQESLDCDLATFVELRFKYNALQLYSLDGLANIMTLLSKMLEYYELPFVYSWRFVGPDGHNIFSFIEPAIILVRRMLTYLIEARGTEYKDLTHVSVLIDIYALAKSVPVAAETYGQTQSVTKHIVKTLLAYTDPSAQIEIYAKSLWTLMLSDVLKFILKGSYCFLPGFLLLSELLPLPLPLPCKTPLSDDEVNELKAARQLWSAHIHPLAGPLHDLLATLAYGSYPPLLQLMRRVGVQLADVAAPTALILARAILDPLLATLAKPDGSGWEIPALAPSARLLHFLSFTITHPSVKAAVLSLITSGANVRTDERLLTLMDGFTLILKTPGNTAAHIQSQECVLLIFQAMLDADNTLVPCAGNPSGLANALPARELIVTIIAALLDHVSASDHPMPCLLLALKALILLTDNDFGFYRLKIGLDSRRDAIFNVLSRLSNEISREHTGALNALHFTLALLREFVLDAPTPMRTLTMTPDELGRALKWGEKDHPLLKIHECLKEWSATGESLNNLCDSAGDLVKLLGKSDPEAASLTCKDEEPTLPAAMPLMKQFSSSPVFIVREPDVKALSSSYWSNIPVSDEAELESELVQYDLIELCNNFLPDLNLTNEVQRVCRLKPSPEEEKKTENTKFPLSGARTRRPFVAPMRGRGGRPTQQRGDLFRSRPPNTSRPPSLHVDDFVALETCGQQPTGPTGYNKVSVRNVKEVIGNRVRGRGRGFGASPYPRRESPRPVSRGKAAWAHEELRAPPTSRFRAWQTEDVRRIHPFPR